MAPFNFHSIQTLEISQADNPIVDIKDGRLVITAVRGDERIMITAPMGNKQDRLIPAVAKSVTNKSKRHKTYVRMLPVNDKRVGETNHLAKLNESQVREIIELLADKEMKKKYQQVSTFYAEIGKIYGVGLHTISNIDRGVSWKHVAR
jgi:hypothetical protein